jgi:hypothetical protein
MWKIFQFFFLWLILIPFNGNSQVVQVESIELDRLVWGKINRYLISIGKKPIPYFEDSLMREYSYRVTRDNSSKEMIEHSDSVGYVCTAECIFRQQHKGINNHMQELIIGHQYDEIATYIFEGWLHSPSHLKFISIDNYAATTVTTVMKYNATSGEASVTASWHCLDYPHIWTTEKNYVYKPN